MNHTGSDPDFQTTSSQCLQETGSDSPTFSPAFFPWDLAAFSKHLSHVGTDMALDSSRFMVGPWHPGSKRETNLQPWQFQPSARRSCYSSVLGCCTSYFSHCFSKLIKYLTNATWRMGNLISRSSSIQPGRKAEHSSDQRGRRLIWYGQTKRQRNQAKTRSKHSLQRPSPSHLLSQDKRHIQNSAACWTDGVWIHQPMGDRARSNLNNHVSVLKAVSLAKGIWGYD